MIDVAAYLDRIGCNGAATLGTVHRAHVTSIPFENLDAWSGRPVSLDLVDVERKLVTERQGGYCFEHNLLLQAELQQLGYDVELLLARARTGGWPGPIRPRTHLVLRVCADDQTSLADVGFGLGGCLDPLPCRVGGPYSQSGWRFRVVSDESELVVQAARGEQWVDLYGVTLSPVPLIDVETANWMTSTYPGSPFVRGPVISATASNGHRTLLRSDTEHEFVLVEQQPDRRVTTPLRRSELSAILETRFGPDAARVPTADQATPRLV
ncbi:MAG: arylamine N-acetyltransferase family protein [Solirubrobacteraceae bacterium]